MTGACVAVCICTFRRPEGLRRLLASLDALVLMGPEWDVLLIVVDNDFNAPAERDLGPIAALSHFPLAYAVEPRRGIAAARNRCLAMVPPKAEFVAFVDDDERVTPLWLVDLVAAIRTHKATAVQGRVMPEFTAPPPAWMARHPFYRIGPYAEGLQLPQAATNNLLIDAAFLRHHQLRFDDRFGLTGGEDQELTRRLKNLGGRIVATEGALVHDMIPAERATEAWLRRRSWRLGNSLGRIARLHRKGRARRLAKGAAQAAVGVLLTPIALPFPAWRVKATGLMMWGLGTLAAFAGHEVEEYRAPPRASSRGHPT